MADGVFEIGVGEQGVAAGGVESGVAEEFGDDDDVDLGELDPLCLAARVLPTPRIETWA
ncbi:hypothetical protein [Streptosporangium sp. H16]|uniref:hypothetical protein n=1 Tax=Streptosporangium sp. H16 TaxID=3444184 RepID=UPI003F7A08A0